MKTLVRRRTAGFTVVLALLAALVAVGVLPAAAETQNNPLPTVDCGGMWHWVHNQLPDGVTSGTLTVVFQRTGVKTVQSTFKNGTLHYRLSLNDGDKLLSAEDDVTGGMLVLSQWPDCSSTTTTTVVTTSSLPTQTPSCTLPVPAGAIKVTFKYGPYDFIRSDGTELQAVQGPYPVSIPAGVYNISLESFDLHVSPSGVAASQPHEQYYVDGVGVAWKSAAIADLPDLQNELAQQVNAGVAVPALTQIEARHAYYPDTSSPNSIRPVCAVFDPVPPPTTTTTAPPTTTTTAPPTTTTTAPPTTTTTAPPTTTTTAPPTTTTTAPPTTTTTAPPTTTTTAAEPGHIIIHKTVQVTEQDQALLGEQFSFTASYDEGGFTLSNGQQNDSGPLPAGTYSVSEALTSTQTGDGWLLASATCSNEDDPGSIQLGAGQTVDCTFVNSKVGGIQVSTTSTSSTVPSTGTLPYTGGNLESMSVLGLAILALGGLVLALMRGREEEDEIGKGSSS